MKWTPDKPTQSGWYFWRSSQDPRPYIMHIVVIDGQRFLSEDLQRPLDDYVFLGREGNWSDEPVPEPEEVTQ